MFLAVLAWGMGKATADSEPGAATQYPGAPGEASASEATYPFALAPPKPAGPLVVRARLDINQINEIDDSAENFEFSGVLTLSWQDPRQAFDPAVEGVKEKIYTGNFQFDEISPGWYPQLVLVNESGLLEKSAVILRVRPDGTSILTETLNARAESKLDMRRFPFDHQHLKAAFQVLGYDKDEVQLVADTGRAPAPDSRVRIPQWNLQGISDSTEEWTAPYAGQGGLASTYIVTIDMKRQPFYMMRLVVFPLFVIVLLSFTVFWMDRSSLGDRVSVSFIGILTAVAYLMVTGDNMPRIGYATLIHGFLNLSLIIMTITVVFNLMVGALEQKGEPALALRIDHICRWAFPLAYLGLMGVMVVSAFSFY
ncbi:hypothetical protein [Thiohalocapsa marina]|nr:hypothetical protein [Thiohalocapsa marina]